MMTAEDMVEEAHRRISLLRLDIGRWEAQIAVWERVIEMLEPDDIPVMPPELAYPG